MTDEELYLGIDMGFDEDVVTVPTGDIQVAVGRSCLEQDLINALSTPRGDLWCHPNYGIDIYKFLHIENIEIHRLELIQEVTSVIEKDPRVQVGTVKVEILSWDLRSIKLKAACTPITGGNPINLVAGYGLDSIEVEVV